MDSWICRLSRKNICFRYSLYKKEDNKDNDGEGLLKEWGESRTIEGKWRKGIRGKHLGQRVEREIKKRKKRKKINFKDNREFCFANFKYLN